MVMCEKEEWGIGVGAFGPKIKSAKVSIKFAPQTAKHLHKLVPQTADRNAAVKNRRYQSKNYWWGTNYI